MNEAGDLLRQRLEGRDPKWAIILGSGLGSIAEEVVAPLYIPYADLPDFPAGNVAGHAGRLIVGELYGQEVIIFQGRAHYYEHGKADIMKPAIRALKSIGIEHLLLTNAAGSLRPDMAPGSVMLITDHLNLTGISPLFGESGNERFVNMIDAYDPAIRAAILKAASQENVSLHQGVYCWFAGPQFETPAEIRMAQKLGGDAVGMSTVPEVIMARHLGMKVAAFSIITNLGAGMSDEEISHQQTMTQAKLALEKMRRLFRGFFAGVTC